MSLRKQRIQYHFSVEGETEKWYLQWLQQQINNNPRALYQVVFLVKVEPNPESYVKKISIVNKTEIVHFFDFEGTEEKYQKRINSTLDSLKNAKKRKSITYEIAYSNYAFELWILLHRGTFCKPLSHRGQYLDSINTLFHENFEDLRQYKKEDNFKRLLAKLTLNDVYVAIKNAQKINLENQRVQKKTQYKGYEYYLQNPSLSVGEVIENILKKVALYT